VTGVLVTGGEFLVTSTHAHDDWRPSANWDRLRLRARLLARARGFFAAQGFLEVETPLLSHDVVVDRYLDPLGVTLPSDPRRPDVGPRMWLQTSPEFGMKRLMAAGGEAIFQITRAFRAGEVGAHHNPEFTMIEWYRRGDGMDAGMELLSALAATLLECPPAERLSYAAAFHNYVGIDPHRADEAQMADAARRLGLSVSEQFRAEADRDNWLNLLLAHGVEPHLGQGRPTILHSYPGSQAALARVVGEPPVAERFELYVRGIELANGYHELLDPRVLRDRNHQAAADRATEEKPALPHESRLLQAMDHGLPACAGVALGFDRLVMLAAGATTLAEVMAFPIDRA